MCLGKIKKVTVILTALIIGYAAIGGAVGHYGVNAVEGQTTESNLVKTEEYAPLIEKEDSVESHEETVIMWKATLSEYKNSLSVVDYETVEVEEEVPEETVAEETTEGDTDGYIETGSYTGYDTPERQQMDISDVQPGNFVFTTYGYGHGVGLSQNGANFYASYSGWDYQQILQHYYPGTYISNTGTAEKETISAGGVSGSVLDVVSMVVNTEIGSSMSTEAIKAQAVAIYTYIKYYGGSVNDLYTTANPPQNIIDAVKSVLGETICYDGGYALAMFGASSGGSTASCYDIFYEDIPYLRSVDCEYDSMYDPHYGSAEVISAEDVKWALESNLGITLSDDPYNWISIIEGDGGYAAYVEVDGQVTIKGNDFRYYMGLKSPKFSCTYY